RSPKRAPYRRLGSAFLNGPTLQRQNGRIPPMRRLDPRRLGDIPRQAGLLLRDFTGLRRLWPHLSGQKRLLFWAVLLVPVVSLFQMALPLILKVAIDQGVAKGDFNAL